MTDTAAITLESANAQLARVFAPWVAGLQPRVESIDAESVVMRMPWSEQLCRSHHMVCGQALMALIDTCMVFVCYAAQGRYGNCTTVSQNTSFMRPVIDQDVIATGRVLKPGRQLIFGEVTLRAAGDQRVVASGTSTYMLLPD